MQKAQQRSRQPARTNTQRQRPGAASGRKRPQGGRQGQSRKQKEKSVTQSVRQRLAEPAPKRGKIDRGFLFLVLLLLVFGLIMQFSASMPESVRAWILSDTQDKSPYANIIKQSIFAALGIAAMVVTMNFDFRLYKKLAGKIFVVALILMLLVPFIGVTAGGAKRWLGVGNLTFQPSEILKIALIIYLAKVLSDMGEQRIKSFQKGVMPVFFILAIAAATAVLQSHLSATILLAGITIAMLVGAGMQWKHFGIMAAIGGAGAALLTWFASYRVDRIEAWIDPFNDLQGIGWQIVQSLYAIGSGGLFGLGLGESREKHLWLPEAENDYIFSVVCEELGFIGALVVIVLFALFLWRGYTIALKAPDRFSSLLVFGIMSMMGLQIIINIGVVTNTLPSTGMQLPFFSSGGTSLIFVMAAMGMVLNVSRYNKDDLG